MCAAVVAVVPGVIERVKAMEDNKATPHNPADSVDGSSAGTSESTVMEGGPVPPPKGPPRRRTLISASSGSGAVASVGGAISSGNVVAAEASGSISFGQRQSGPAEATAMLKSAPVVTPSPLATPSPLERAVAAATAQPPVDDATPEPAPVAEDMEATPESALADIGPGTIVSQYELIRKIGEGGMGMVWVARDTKLGRRVAIKFLLTVHPELTQRFILEARATARCSHESIVIIYEVGEFKGTPFMVLEFLQGHPLSGEIEGGKRIPPARVVELMVPVLKALAVAHGHGIVHRDLKPDNIFVTDTGTIKVLDFGIAKVLEADARPEEPAGAVHLPQDLGDEEDEFTELTRRGAIMGTMSYMSPEQWGIGVEIDHRTDIWAVGIMLYRMIAGQHPLAPLRGQQLVVTAMLNKPMPTMREARSDIPEALASVIDKCLLKYKEQRWGSATELLKALEPFLPGRYTRELRSDESPYTGLSSFQETDADRFFGRSQEIAAMVTRIRDQPIMGVVGSSGVGKSSFVRAGVVPALKHSGENWETLVIRPGREPIAALASIMSGLVGNTTSTTVADDVTEVQETIERLYREPGYLATVMRSRARREGKHILLFVDQFEELYTLIPDQRERLAFTACLAAIADDAASPLRVVLSIRSDFLDRVPEDQFFMGELSKGLFFMQPPGRDGLRDAIAQPAEMAGYHFETSDVVEHMLDHLESTPGALPLLQFAATKLWEMRDKQRKLLTVASYNQLGGIAGALASHADSVLRELTPAMQNLARGLLMRLVTSDRTRAIVAIDDLLELHADPREVNRLIEHLTQARLLVVQTTGSGGTVEIVHESLITGWPTLRRWLDDIQEDAAYLEELRTAAKQWETKKRDAGLLWRGEAMEEARRFRKRYSGELPAGQIRYLDAVMALADRAARRRRTLFIGSMSFLILLVAAAAVALVVIRDSQKKATRAAIVAKKAETAAKVNEDVAKQRLAQVVAKERQRKAAEAGKKAAEVKVVKIDKQLDQTNDQLILKNKALEGALKDAQAANLQAKAAKKRAETNEARALQAEKTAVVARTDAIKAKARVDVLLKKERARAKRLEKKLGSRMIEKLN